MKILYDHQIFSRQRYGGISRYFYETANRIARIDGAHTEIFAPLYINEYVATTDPARLLGRKMPPLPYSARAMRLVDTAATYLAIRPRRDIDIYHETYYAKADTAPSSACRVVTVFDMIHELMPGDFPATDSTRALKAIAVRRADHVICISENTRRDLIRITGIPESKTSVVHLGYSLAAPRNAVVAQPRLERPFLLYVGARNGYKNFASLLTAYSRSNLLRREFCIACFGGGAITTKETELMRQLGLAASDLIALSGDDEVLSGLYAAAAVFVYTSLYEGFGIPPLESMSFGCPVVCTNASSLPEVVGDAAELFDPADPEQLRVAIETVVTSRERRLDLITRGHQRTRLFSWDKCAHETLEVYRNLLGAGLQ